MLVFVVFSNVCNYISIASSSWVTTYPPSGSVLYTPYSLWNLDVTTIALVVTGTAFNIISLVFALASLIAALFKFLRDRFAIIFVIGTLASSLLALVFDSIGWYYVLSNLNQVQKQSSVAYLIRFDWGFWLLVPAFGFSVLGAVCASSIVGCSVGSVKQSYTQKNKLQVYEKNTGSMARAGELPFSQKMTEVSFQNEAYQSEQSNVLRL